MEFLILILLVLINAVLAAAEIAIVSSRKSKLAQMASEGNAGAQIALDLARRPDRFLSTIQVGITLVGVLAGTFSGLTLASHISQFLKTIPFFAPWSDALAVGAIVICVTYLQLILGELVPKRIALVYPEKIAIYFAASMNALAQITSPVVTFLTVSTNVILSLLRVKNRPDLSVSVDEVRMLIREGTKSGVFEKTEQDIVERTLKLGDKKVGELMNARSHIVWLDIDSTFADIRNRIIDHPHSCFPVCKDSLDKVLGIVRAEDLLADMLKNERVDLKKSLLKPIFVPETMSALKVLELFKKSGIHMALIIDEYGAIKGLVALNDLLEEVVGDLPSFDEIQDKEIIKREDGSYLIDGLAPISEVKEKLHIKNLPNDKDGNFHTVGGFVMYKLGKIPTPGDTFEAANFEFEVMDMDKNRIDKILIKPKL